MEPQKSPFQIRSMKDQAAQATAPKNYAQPNMRFSDLELAALKAIFGGEHNEGNIKLLRKLFLPNYDPDAPLQQNIDLWMTINLADLSQEEALVRMYARNEVINHIEQRLNQIQILANMEAETPGEQAERLKRNSNQ